MKAKTKKILAVVVAVLFSLTIIGGIILSILLPKSDTLTASASSYEEEYPNGYGAPPYVVTTDYDYFGSCYFTIDPDLVVFPESLNLGNSFTIDLPFNVYFGVLAQQCSSIQFGCSNGCIRTITITNSEGAKVQPYRPGRYGTRYIFLPGLKITDLTGELAPFALFLIHCVTPCVLERSYNQVFDNGYNSGYNDCQLEWNETTSNSYEEGYNVGFSEGYNSGYGIGINKGHSDQITNPIIAFIEPVHKFMNTEFFGSLTYATIFNVVLFVAVAVIFIKMFSGG